MEFTSADDNLYIIIKRIYAEYDVAISNVFKNTNGIVNTHHDLTTENVFKISDNNGGLTSISSGAPNNADYMFTLTQDAT